MLTQLGHLKMKGSPSSLATLSWGMTPGTSAKTNQEKNFVSEVSYCVLKWQKYQTEVGVCFLESNSIIKCIKLIFQNSLISSLRNSSDAVVICIFLIIFYFFLRGRPMSKGNKPYQLSVIAIMQKLQHIKMPEIRQQREKMNI